jgi:hypothetical protein
MNDRIKTLLIDSNGPGWRRAVVDTVLRGLLRIGAEGAGLPAHLARLPFARRLLREQHDALSYVVDWREALCASPLLDAEVCNINNLVEFVRRRDALASFPLVFILHGATADSLPLLQRTVRWFQSRRGALVVFVGNEYELMAEKCAFIRSAGADYVCSQLPLEAARWLYAGCHPVRVLAIPHALNPEVYYPDPGVTRRVDVGFVGDVYPAFIGDQERTTLIDTFRTRANEFGLVNEFHMNSRLPRLDWARFLRTCRATIGAESGSYFLDRDGRMIAGAKAYLASHPDAAFEDVFDRFFRSPPVDYVSGKCISSRHFEPIGTKTCQVLLEGHYNGILKAEEHYIQVRKDLSNLKDVVGQLKDAALRTAIVERAYAYVMEQHTYQHRIQAIVHAVLDSAADSEEAARWGKDGEHVCGIHG